MIESRSRKQSYSRNFSLIEDVKGNQLRKLHIKTCNHLEFSTPQPNSIKYMPQIINRVDIDFIQFVNNRYDGWTRVQNFDKIAQSLSQQAKKISLIKKLCINFEIQSVEPWILDKLTEVYHSCRIQNIQIVLKIAGQGSNEDLEAWLKYNIQRLKLLANLKLDLRIEMSQNFLTKFKSSQFLTYFSQFSQLKKFHFKESTDIFFFMIPIILKKNQRLDDFGINNGLMQQHLSLIQPYVHDFKKLNLQVNLRSEVQELQQLLNQSERTLRELIITIEIADQNSFQKEFDTLLLPKSLRKLVLSIRSFSKQVCLNKFIHNIGTLNKLESLSLTFSISSSATRIILDNFNGIRKLKEFSFKPYYAGCDYFYISRGIKQFRNLRSLNVGPIQTEEKQTGIDQLTMLFTTISDLWELRSLSLTFKRDKEVVLTSLVESLKNADKLQEFKIQFLEDYHLTQNNFIHLAQIVNMLKKLKRFNLYAAKTELGGKIFELAKLLIEKKSIIKAHMEFKIIYIKQNQYLQHMEVIDRYPKLTILVDQIKESAIVLLKGMFFTKKLLA